MNKDTNLFYQRINMKAYTCTCSMMVYCTVTTHTILFFFLQLSHASQTSCILTVQLKRKLSTTKHYFSQNHKNFVKWNLSTACSYMYVKVDSHSNRKLYEGESMV